MGIVNPALGGKMPRPKDPKPVSSKRQQKALVVWGDKDQKLTCRKCGKPGLRYGNRSGMCQSCFQGVPGRLKARGGRAIGRLFDRVGAWANDEDISALSHLLHEGDLAGAARAVRLTPQELLAVLMPSVANDDAFEGVREQ